MRELSVSYLEVENEVPVSVLQSKKLGGELFRFQFLEIKYCVFLQFSLTNYFHRLALFSI